jgi:hypothetical protein
MRRLYLVALLLLTVSVAGLQAQARPVPHRLIVKHQVFELSAISDSAKHRPFFLPRQGESPAFWIGYGAGLAVSPLLWCDRSGCGALDKATTSLALGAVGAISALLLSRTF